jgi:hypothetical protein
MSGSTRLIKAVLAGLLVETAYAHTDKLWLDAPPTDPYPFFAAIAHYLTRAYFERMS